MKAIMISIKPKWVAKILNGEKTIEIRRTMPKCDLPIEVYIYCTKGKETIAINPYGGYATIPNKHKNEYFNGKVVAKFTLNKVEEINVLFGSAGYHITQFNTQSYCHNDFIKASCLTVKELENYLDTVWWNGKAHICGYAWYISNLVIFDRPKELSEFKTAIEHKKPKDIGLNMWVSKTIKPLTKAPQSWCYVEVEQ